MIALHKNATVIVSYYFHLLIKPVIIQCKRFVMWLNPSVAVICFECGMCFMVWWSYSSFISRSHSALHYPLGQGFLGAFICIILERFLLSCVPCKYFNNYCIMMGIGHMGLLCCMWTSLRNCGHLEICLQLFGDKDTDAVV